MADIDGLEPETWIEPTTDDAALERMPTVEDVTNPVWVGLVFIVELQRDELNVPRLRELVTPESISAWGDFTEARNLLNAIPNAGYSSAAPRAYEAIDVAYPRMLDRQVAFGHDGPLIFTVSR